MEGICVESAKCARLKSNHRFTMTIRNSKPSHILLVSRYAALSRQEMYWERREDCHNLVVSAMMTKTKFLECKQYLHLPDNTALNSSDKFAKTRP